LLIVLLEGVKIAGLNWVNNSYLIEESYLTCGAHFGLMVAYSGCEQVQECFLEEGRTKLSVQSRKE
jgi:hypothetical protein